jgi:hypothetical protein
MVFKKIISSLFILVCIFLYTHKVSAATIAVTPASATVSQGSTFTVSVRVDTEDKSVNVAETHISFPSDILKIVSVSPGTNFTLQTPGSPSKTNTEAFFSAGIPSPGYKGSSGLLGKITFKAVGSGVATISVKDGKVFLNDGDATDAYRAGISSSITITPVQDKQKDTQTTTTTPVVTTPEVTAPIDLEAMQPQQVTPNPSQVVATFSINVHDLFIIILILVIIIIILLAIIVYLLIRLNKSQRGRNYEKSSSQGSSAQTKSKSTSKTEKV